LSQLARLAEEVGEVSRILNAAYGDKPKKPTDATDDLGDELSDIMWSVVCLANSQGIDLEPHMQAQFEKLTVRDKGRFAKKQ
jgi:NTP pyrophosphatase (non-canonical NTP hydrolase)